MKFLLLIAGLLTLTNADVSHLVNQQGSSGYHYQNPPLSSYGVPQASVLGNVGQSVSYSNYRSASLPSLSLPSASGSSLGFNSVYSTPSPVTVTVQGYNGFSTPASYQASTPAPSVDYSNFQVSTPAPSLSYVSSPAPSVALSGYQVSTPSPVNLVQYSQPSSSYQFLSKLSQPSYSVPSSGFSAQFGSDASLNSGITFGSNSFGSAGVVAGKTSGGNLNEAFGVVTDAASGQVAVESDVSKNLYFFAAPEEEDEEIQAKIDLPPVPPKKSYKIIFIKAPAYRNQQTITIPAPPQNDEKTLVYVLVKKPEGQAKVKFQSAAPVQQSKPEVFFIKYKTQKEAEAAVAEIQSKHGASGHVIANLPAGAQSVAGGLSALPTPSTVNFGGSDIGSLNNVVTVSSTPSPLSFASNNLGSLNNLVSSTPYPLSFGSSGDLGSLNNVVSVSSTPSPLSFGSSGDLGSLNNVVSVSSTPSPLSFGSSSDFGSLNGIVTVSSTPSPVSFGGSFIGANNPSGSLSGGLSFDSLGANSFVSTTPASVGFASSTPQAEGGQFNYVQSSTVAPSTHEDSAVVVNAEGEQHVSEAPGNNYVSQEGIEQRTGENESGNKEGESSQVAGFVSYGPPKY